MELIEKYPDQKELIQLGNHCIWCWQCSKLARAYCDTEELVDWHDIDGMLVNIFKEYTILQIAKLHDNIKMGKFYNHSISYVIDRIPNNQNLLVEYNDFCDRNKIFVDSIREARSKTIAHNDATTVRDGKILGAFPINSEIKYFEELRVLMSLLYNRVGIGVFPDWPDFSEEDIQDFIQTLIKTKSC